MKLNRWGEGNNFIMTADMKAFLDGLIIGDAGYARHKYSSALQMSQISDHKDWIESIILALNSGGIIAKFSTTKAHERIVQSGTRKGSLIRAKECLHLYSLSYRTLLAESQRWYPNGTKIIPHDIDITNPIMLAQWYMGDGCINTLTGRYELKLATNSFSEEDVIWLSDQFDKKLSIHGIVNHWRGQPILHFQHHNADRFIKIVKPHIVPSFQYKVPDNPWRPSKCQTCNKSLTGLQRKHCRDCQPIIRQQQKERAWQQYKLKHSST